MNNESVERFERKVKSMKKMKITNWICVALFASIPYTAQASDEYEDWISWWGGGGQKTQVNCEEGYYAYGMQNIDHGNSNQSADMMCRKIDEFLPAGVSIDHDNCENESVNWWGGYGTKPWATCDDGKYAVGFAIYDYGSNNQAINKMRCCEVEGINTAHKSTYNTRVQWWPGSGDKGFELCGEGYFITGIRIKDHGSNDQSVYEIKCSKPSYTFFTYPILW